jgi:predicted nucleotidyltransferase
MLETDRRRLDEIAQQFGLDLIVLFGSHAKGRMVPGSDVDIAVRAVKRPGGDWNWEFEVADALSSTLQEDGGEVDVVFLNGAAPLLMFEVARSGQVLFEKEWGTFSDFRSYAARVYYDNESRFRRQAQYLKERFP